MSNRKADNLLLFKSIVDAGSLSTAAKECEISVSQVSKRMTYLENKLGVQLLHRSTRKLALTPPGEMLYKKLSTIKQEIDDAWQSMLDYSTDPRGEIRIVAPVYFALNKLINYVKTFNAQHPGINVNLELNHSEQNLEEPNYDITFKSHILGPGQLIPDSQLYAKKVESEQLVYVAGREYVKQHGLPQNPEDLKQHKCLAINIKDKKNWKFYHDENVAQHTVDLVFETNSFEALYKAARDNMGIAQVPMNLVTQDSDNLVVLFQDHQPETLDTYAYYTANKSASKKVSLFLDEIMQNKTL